jgi:hypothetical protein
MVGAFVRTGADVVIAGRDEQACVEYAVAIQNENGPPCAW